MQGGVIPKKGDRFARQKYPIQATDINRKNTVKKKTAREKNQMQTLSFEQTNYVASIAQKDHLSWNREYIQIPIMTDFDHDYFFDDKPPSPWLETCFFVEIKRVIIARGQFHYKAWKLETPWHELKFCKYCKMRGLYFCRYGEREKCIECNALGELISVENECDRNEEYHFIYGRLRGLRPLYAISKAPSTLGENFDSERFAVERFIDKLEDAILSDVKRGK